MKPEVDMHLHSLCSDGLFEPEAVAQKIKVAGLRGGVLTDHDLFFGTQSFLAACRRLDLVGTIAGETSVFDRGIYAHILVYNAEKLANGPQTAEFLSANWQAQNDRTMVGLARHQQAGLISPPFDLPHLRQMFDRHEPYISYNKIYLALAQKRGLTYQQAKAISKSNGLKKISLERSRLINAIAWLKHCRSMSAKPVLAHPCLIKQIEKAEDPAQIEDFLNQLLDQWQPAGLTGIEVFHSEHAPWQEELLWRIAQKRGLFASGGSDWHGYEATVTPGQKGVSLESFEKFLAE